MSKNQDAQFEKALSVLDEVSLLVEVQGEPYKIRNFRFLEGLKVVNILKQHPNAIPFDLFGMDENTQTDEMIKVVMEAIAQAGDVIAEILKLHLKKDDQWMEQLEFDEVVKLTLAVVKANVDFFQETLLPLIPTSIKENFSEERAN